jgi:hypothetical protein
MQREDKLTDLADKEPRVALVYGMAIVIGVLATVASIEFYWIKDLIIQVNASQASCEAKIAEANKNSQAREDIFQAKIAKQYEDRAADQDKKAADQEDRILELKKVVESLLNQSSVVNTKFLKIESKVDQVSGNTKKIEEVIKQ